MRPREGGVSKFHGADRRHAPVPRRDQPPDKCQGAPGGLRSVDTHDDAAYALRPPDHEYRAFGATDDAAGNAAHKQATSDAMTAPADHDHIGLKTFGLAGNSLDWRFVQKVDFDVGPAARKGAPCTLGRLLSAHVECAR